ncbi:anion permease [Paenibacillus alvei]|uniref:Anion transporter n=1 Tax=Paenibacillus alvei TaxID=44250 RepID=A0A383RKD9_PAEAL
MSNKPLQPDGHSTDKQKEGGKKGRFETLFKKIGIPLAILVFLILVLIPTPEGLEPQAQKAIAIFASALVLWVSGALPIYLTSMIAIIMLSLSGTTEEKTAFGTLGFDVIWLMYLPSS